MENGVGSITFDNYSQKNCKGNTMTPFHRQLMKTYTHWSPKSGPTKLLDFSDIETMLEHLFGGMEKKATRESLLVLLSSLSPAEQPFDPVFEHPMKHKRKEPNSKGEETEVKQPKKVAWTDEDEETGEKFLQLKKLVRELVTSGSENVSFPTNVMNFSEDENVMIFLEKMKDEGLTLEQQKQEFSRHFPNHDFDDWIECKSCDGSITASSWGSTDTEDEREYEREHGCERIELELDPEPWVNNSCVCPCCLFVKISHFKESCLENTKASLIPAELEKDSK